jgi:hypothetical protein
VIGHALLRRGRLLWWWMLAGAAWRNRRDILRWLGFARSAVTERGTRPVAELLTEVRVRAAVTADAGLRQDPGLRDLRVRDGVVTLATSRADWPQHSDPMRRLEKIKGVASVRTDGIAHVERLTA